jgi:hypothetical protein
MVATVTWLTVTEHMCHGHVPVLSQIMTHHLVCNKSRTTVPLVEQELIILPVHMCSPPVFSGFRVAYFLCFFSVLVGIVFPVYLRFTASDYPFGIFNIFLLA